MTHLLLGAVHNIITGAHRNAVEMAHELQRLVVWWPPESLRKDCNTWTDRCKLCTAVHHKAKMEPPARTVRSLKPFMRVQIDHMEIKPAGMNGERYIFTPID